MKNIFKLSLAVTAAVIISGCGNGSSITDANINYNQQNVFNAVPPSVQLQNYNVLVKDDIIKGAKVSAYECNSSIEVGNGLYTLQNCVSKPSFILVEGGTIGNTGTKQTFPLLLNTSQSGKDDNFVVTPLTTLVANASSQDMDTLAKKLGIKKEDIFTDPEKVSNMTKLLQKINAIYLKAEADGAVANKVLFVTAVREAIVNNTNGQPDFNVTKVGIDVQKSSLNKPKMFGIVFTGDLQDNDDILSQIAKAQQPANATFLGLVFDDVIPNADIRIYKADDNSTMATTKADANGKFSFTLSSSWLDRINNSDFVIVLEAKSGKIVLKSSITSSKLRNMLNKYKKITPSKEDNLVISNVTTIKHAVLKKNNAFNDVKSYENNLTYLQTYYGDKLLKASAVLKYVVDNNDTNALNKNGASDTYHLAVQLIDVNISNNKIDVNDSVPQNAGISSTVIQATEQNISSNALLAKQLVSNTSDTGEKNGFEEAAKNANNVFYRLLAYYDANGEFIREYTKIITFTGGYESTTCYIKGDAYDTDWDCNEPIKISNANFNNGIYNVVDDNGIIIQYSLDGNQSIYVDKVNKSYMLYEVTKSLTDIDGNVTNVQELLVDNYDIVDMFRRMPDIDSNSYNELKSLVQGKNRNEVNAELNRYVREKIDTIKKYFTK